jgi:hypothetical protein
MRRNSSGAINAARRRPRQITAWGGKAKHLHGFI